MASPSSLGRATMFLCWLLFGAATWAEPSWHFAVPDNAGIYGEFYLELKTRLPSSERVRLVELDQQPQALPPAALWLAVGPQALRRIWQEQPKATVISLLNTRDTVENLRASLKASGPFTAIYHDPEPRRQMRLAKAVLPKLRSLGLLVRPGRSAETMPLQTLAQNLGLRLVVREIAGSADLVPKLVDVLERSDALLALPDPGIINRQTLKTILLTAYRHERVLIGSSEAMVAAGSLASTHSTAAQTAEHLAGWLEEIPRTSAPKLPNPEYTRAFTLSYNNQVAHSLSLVAPDLRTLETLLLEAERAPSIGVSAP
ncbi:MAG: hypothetical protein HYV16_09750 [Gammaproteobacteria bacterium]|nr:hypothetical protein [Gammaproteobacteria bacterium]